MNSKTMVLRKGSETPISMDDGNPEWHGFSGKSQTRASRNYEDMLFGPPVNTNNSNGCYSSMSRYSEEGNLPHSECAVQGKFSKGSGLHQSSHGNEMKYGGTHRMTSKNSMHPPNRSTAASPAPQSSTRVSTKTDRSSSKVNPGPLDTRAKTPGGSRAYNRRYRSNHEASYVDETLFGQKTENPPFHAPWEKPSDYGSKQYSLDCTDYRAKSKMPTDTQTMIAIGTQTILNPHNAASSRPASRLEVSNASARPSSRQAVQRPGTATRNTHKASYVDDTLFGPKPVEPSWAAPWDKEKKTKPLLFGSSDVKVTVSHNIETCKERPRKDLRSAGAGVPRPPSRTGARPVWK